MQNLTQEELNERVAILKRYRKLLEEQKSKFEEYLKVLESHQKQIDVENAESITAHSRLETQIVGSISNLQKVIEPMKLLYQTSNAAKYSPEESICVERITSELSSLHTRVLAQNEINKKLLQSHMVQVKNQMSQIHNPYRTARSVYAERAAVGSVIYTEA